MKIEDIVSEWSKDCKIDETELGHEASKIPQLHNKYLKIFMGERVALIKAKSNHKKIKIRLTEYFLGEMDRDELTELGRDQFYKKLLKNEIGDYIEADDLFIESALKVALQQEKVDYLESIIKSITTRNFMIKSAVDWAKFCSGV